MATSVTTPSSLLSIPTAQAAPSLGVQAKSPTQNLTAPSNTLAPKQQAAAPTIKDLSGTYANVNGTIYNKTTNQGYSDPNSFFKDAGVSNFNNLKFDTTWRPPTTNTGNGIAPAQSIPTGLSFGSGRQATGGASPAPAAPTAPTPTANTPYSPPKQGTTGVSQGGIIGNLLGIAQNESPQVTTARANLQNLQNEYAQKTADILGGAGAGDLSLAGGREGLLNQLYASKNAAAQTALSSALTSQGQAITATQAAGGLNAPVVTSPGQVQISPSNPIGGGGNFIGIDQNTLNTYAQMLATGQGSAIPGTVTGNTALMASLVNLAKQINPNFNINTASGLGQSQYANALTGGTAATNLNADVYKQYGTQAYNLATTLNSVKDITNQTFEAANGQQINPFTFAPANALLSDVKRLLSNNGQAQFDASIAGLKNQLTAMYAASGGGTPTGFEDRMNQMTNGTMQLGTFLNMINTDAQNGQTILNNVLSTAQSANQVIQNNSGSSGGGNSTTLGLF